MNVFMLPQRFRSACDAGSQGSISCSGQIFVRSPDICSLGICWGFSLYLVFSADLYCDICNMRSLRNFIQVWYQKPCLQKGSQGNLIKYFIFHNSFILLACSTIHFLCLTELIVGTLVGHCKADFNFFCFLFRFICVNRPAYKILFINIFLDVEPAVKHEGKIILFNRLFSLRQTLVIKFAINIYDVCLYVVQAAGLRNNSCRLYYTEIPFMALCLQLTLQGLMQSMFCTNKQNMERC